MCISWPCVRRQDSSRAIGFRRVRHAKPATPTSLTPVSLTSPKHAAPSLAKVSSLSTVPLVCRTCYSGHIPKGKSWQTTWKMVPVWTEKSDPKSKVFDVPRGSKFRRRERERERERENSRHTSWWVWVKSQGQPKRTSDKPYTAITEKILASLHPTDVILPPPPPEHRITCPSSPSNFWPGVCIPCRSLVFFLFQKGTAVSRLRAV